MTVTVFGPQASAPTSCSSGGTVVGTAIVAGAGTYHPSAGFTPSAAGTYFWYASYGGDASNASSSSVCGAAMAETTVTAAGGTHGTINLVRAKVSGTKVRLTLGCTGGPCTGTLRISAVEHLTGNTPTAVVATVKKPRAKKSIDLAGGRYAVGQDATQVVTLALSRNAVRLLAKLHKLSGKLSITPTGATTPAVAKKVTFKSPRHKHKRHHR
jgi:hypothetical protein